MSAALPYLQKQRKGQLVELAEVTALEDYEDFTKPDLAVKLDEHLQANRTIFGSDARLAEYYKRLSQPTRASPVKRESKAENTPPRSVRRRVPKPKEEIEQTDDSDVPAQTPARPLADIAVQLPPSPAIVTEVIDRQAAVWRKSISEAWKDSGVQEQSNSLRATLSSVKSVQILVVAFEGFRVIREVVPLRYLATIPAVELIHTPEISVKIPDLFVLVDSSFWAPVSLWLLTNVLLPLVFAYFFNISLHAQSSGGPASSTRRSRAAHASFDSLSFNISKAVIAYLVYANGFTFWRLYDGYSIHRVNMAIPFEAAGMLTGAAIGGIGTLYEAILRK
ncbi:hypothetical protein P175DRAFT_0466041 [Aspergillus ochraceoroseus IBT 24754]|uniref:Uncharacterized protein n=3 Tax=Aspergillus subgen. Nidulantes TaxID=2720870 RepID=A0A0F8XTF0_9EURO|nr:uncharacterized protein P175DRAFT_0466041 [Aspergillus ochraceoroseus IBT 24754]KKK18188.1 hypothetical protein AOCH_005416 [Aspergillus ochraceoroseus]KKK26802.1 hypothetical protein ARAM_002381 [Aspergillus rambellii]PTU17830.1 hypothetical protein P175DRAFT_0466041 [Aspergillus ochraceoroseus IBT 24754]